MTNLSRPCCRATAKLSTDDLLKILAATLVLHNDAQREYAYGPAQGLPNTKVGAFTQPLYDQAQKHGWIAISMKNDWKRIFAFDD